MGLHDPFEYLQHKFWSKKRPGIKVSIWSQPLKIKNWPEIHVCRWHVTYRWKAFNKGYNFSLKLVSIESLHKKLWASKMVEVPILGTLKLLAWEFWGKWHLSATLVPNHKKNIRGKVLASPILGRGESCESCESKYATGSSGY
jgi:hypothetical protein